MRRITLAALAVFAAAAPADAAERRYTLTGFDKVQVEGPFEVTLATGRGSSATASGSSHALDRVSIQVQGRTLRIKPNRSAWGGYPGANPGAVKIAVSTHELKAAQLSGPGSLTIDKAKGLRFDISLSGSGRLAVAGLEADNLMIGMMGSGKLVLAGKAKELLATIQGSGDLEAKALTTEEARINAATAGNIAVSVRRAAEVTSAGQGETRIIGKPACTVRVLGSGPVLCGG